ncbi:MAG: hypothetical protein JNN01_25735 [Opitutaceae bacterium]|nr:hypothetical protein [Opitutaceae bacterium]
MSDSSRLVSLDAFRGATVAGMLLVNNPGSWGHVYPPLLHAPWHGWTFTDLVFPCFLWIVGVSMTLSFSRRLEEGANRRMLIKHVWIRSFLLFALGLLLTAFPFGLVPTHTFSLHTMRIPGVLQRIAICYLVASAIVVRSDWRDQVKWVVGLLLTYWILLCWIPVPGYGAGVLDPVGNVPGWIDSALLAGHTWTGAPAPGFDPEGILSTIPAIATTLMGCLAGRLLREPMGDWSKAFYLMAAGVVALFVGAVLVRWMPINKNLWTPTFAIFMAGWSALFYALFYGLMEAGEWKRWAKPFIIYGRNAIAMFVLAGLLAKGMSLVQWTNLDGKKVTLKGFVYDGAFAPIGEPRLASLLFAIVFVGFTFAVALLMWRRRWFIKL